jgi:hypothetical protein
MNSTTLQTKEASQHAHDFSISITAAEVPAYLLPELEAFLRDKLTAIVRDNMIWGDMRVSVDYDGRRDCGQHEREMVDVQDENGEWFATYR